MNFKTAAHQTFFERVQAQAMELNTNLGRHPEEPSLLVTFGSVQLHIDVDAWGPLDAKIQIVALAAPAGRVGSSAGAEQKPVDLETLLKLNAKLSFASFSLDEWGNVRVATELLASACTRDVLLAGLSAVGRAKAAFDEAFGASSESEAKKLVHTAALGDPPPSRPMTRIALDNFDIYYCIRGLPISVNEVVQAFAEGLTDAQVLAKYEELVAEDLDEVRRFASQFPEKVQQGFEVKAEEPEEPVETATPPTPMRAVKPPVAPKPRIWLDEMGLYYSIRGLPISSTELFLKMESGMSDAQLLAEYSQLEAEDLDAVREFAAAYPERIERPVVREEVVVKKVVIPPAPRRVLETPAERGEPPRIAADEMGLYYSIRGLTISVELVRSKMDEGLDDDALLAAFPDLERADLDAVRAFDGPPL